MNWRDFLVEAPELADSPVLNALNVLKDGERLVREGLLVQNVHLVRSKSGSLADVAVTTPSNGEPGTRDEVGLLDAKKPESTGHAETDMLIDLVGAHYETPADEYPLIVETSSRDPENALTSFRLMAKNAGLLTGPIPDARIACSACQRLSKSGVCGAARSGEMQDSYPGYSPTPGTLRNCEHYKSRLH